MAAPSASSATSKPIIGYWGIRGMAQVGRLLLAYGLGSESTTDFDALFEDKRYILTKDADGNWDRGVWNVDAKPYVNIPFANLPYLVCWDPATQTELRFTQSLAIDRYLARRFNLVATKPLDQVDADVMEQQLTDVKAAFTAMSYKPAGEQYDQAAAALKARAPGLLGELEAFVQRRGTKWSVADELTYIDFLLYECVDCYTLWAGEAFLADFPKLKALHASFEAIPKVKAYMDSPQFLERPINNLSATFL